jgi:hypothetical protein
MSFHREYPSLSPAGGGAAPPLGALDVPRRRRAVATALPRSAQRFASLVLAAFALACDPYVQGNGVYREVDRSASLRPFAGVHLEDAVEATVTVSDGTAQSVLVSGDANVVDYIKTEVVTQEVLGVPVDVLHVRVEVPGGDYSPSVPVRAVIRMAGLRYLGAREHSRLEARDVTAPDLVVDGAGGSDVEVKGPGGTTLVATLADANADLGGWAVQDAAVMLSGRSSLELRANGTLTGEAHGTSTVTNLVPAVTCTVAVFDTATDPCAPPPP